MMPPDAIPLLAALTYAPDMETTALWAEMSVERAQMLLEQIRISLGLEDKPRQPAEWAHDILEALGRP